MDKAKTVARWIAFCPVACLAAFVTPAAIYFSNRFFLFWGGLDPDGFLGHTYIEAIAGIATGFVFIYVGAGIAPARKKTIAISFAALGLLFAGAGILATLALQRYWQTVQAGFSAVGLSVTAWAVLKGELFMVSKMPQGSPEKPDLTDDNGELIKVATAAVSGLGALMERYPTAILDASNLPLKKSEMKLILKGVMAVGERRRTSNASGNGLRAFESVSGRCW